MAFLAVLGLDDWFGGADSAVLVAVYVVLSIWVELAPHHFLAGMPDEAVAHGAALYCGILTGHGGASAAYGTRVTTEPYSSEDLMATVCKAMGLSLVALRRLCHRVTSYRRQGGEASSSCRFPHAFQVERARS